MPGWIGPLVALTAILSFLYLAFFKGSRPAAGTTRTGLIRPMRAIILVEQIKNTLASL